jgi:hypothetical protein
VHYIILLRDRLVLIATTTTALRDTITAVITTVVQGIEGIAPLL